MNERGFTLLEVMVALAIFATLSLALFSAMQHVTANTASLSERSQAMWIADNRINEMRAGLRPITSCASQEQLQFGARSWWLFCTASATSNPALWQVQVRVSAQPSLAAARRYSRAELFAWITPQP